MTDFAPSEAAHQCRCFTILFLTFCLVLCGFSLLKPGPIQAAAPDILWTQSKWMNTMLSPDAFSDSHRFFVMKQQDSLDVYRTDDGGLQKGVENVYGDIPSVVSSFAISHDEEWLVTGAGLSSYYSPGPITKPDHSAKIWDLRTGQLLKSFPHKGAVTQVALSTDRQWLATATTDYGHNFSYPCGRYDFCLESVVDVHDSHIRLWKVDDRSLLLTTEIQPDGLVSLSFTSDNKLLVGAEKNRIRVWRVSDGSLVWEKNASPQSFKKIILSPDDRLLAAAHSGPPKVGITLFDLQSGAFVNELSEVATTLIFRSLVFTPNGERLEATYFGTYPRSWRTSDGQFLQYIETTDLSPDGLLGAYLVGDTLQIREIATNRILAAYDQGVAEIERVVFSPDHLRFAYRTGTGALVVAKTFASDQAMRGDLNVNGRIEIGDALVALRIMLGLSPLDEDLKPIVDVNLDGQININDVIQILQAVTGIRAEFSSRLPQPDEFTSELAPYWKVKQVAGDTSFPTPSVLAGNGQLQLISADRDVWLNVWEPYAVYQDGIYGNFSMRLKVESPPACNDLSSVGLMVAETIPDRSVPSTTIPSWGLVQVSQGYGVEAKWGGRGFSRTSFLPDMPKTPFVSPQWVRLDRQGNHLSFYRSPDGEDWVSVATSDMGYFPGVLPLRDPISAGIEMQTHCDQTPDSARVSHFQVIPLP